MSSMRMAFSCSYLIAEPTWADPESVFSEYPVLHGPYYVDQNADGGFTYHGPVAMLHGPHTAPWWTPEGYPHRFYVDDTLTPSWSRP